MLNLPFSCKKREYCTVLKSILTKYGLNVGDTFESQKDLANKIGKSEKTIVEWRNKGWIS